MRASSLMIVLSMFYNIVEISDDVRSTSVISLDTAPRSFEDTPLVFIILFPSENHVHVAGTIRNKSNSLKNKKHECIAQFLK